MAFNPLTEGECGQKNPLARLASHVTHDRAFSEAHGHVFPSSSDQLVEQFLQETKTMPQSFRMDDLMREMHEIESQRSLLPPVPASTVKDQLYDDAWARQYIEDGKVFVHDNVNNEAIWAEISSQEEQARMNMFDNWSADYFQDVAAGPSVDVAAQQSARELTETVDDSKFEHSKFMKFMKQVGDGDVTLEEGTLTEEAQAWSKEFLENNSKSEVENLPDNWQKDYEDEFNSQFWKNLQEELKQNVGTNETDENWVSEYDDLNSGPYTEYTFSEDNPMLDVINALERGKILLEEGDLPSAVLCFEAAVKKEPENSEAWFLLGKTQAENEQDPNAIPALRRCLQLDPKNLEALMAIAVSYTNESYYSQAAQKLVTWLANNPKYSDLVPPNLKFTGQVTSFLNPDQHNLIQDLFIKAALRQPDNIDYEVQSGLGVLFNLSGDYEKAADCFRAALSVKYDDAKLWNRLGATLANGSKPEEAVDAYHRALSLEPGFIRARYNVGIICINLRAYREAAEHFLTALNQQARGRDVQNSASTSQMSNTIWSTLRMCISLYNRADLKPAIDNRDLATLNREFGIADNN